MIGLSPLPRAGASESRKMRWCPPLMPATMTAMDRSAITPGLASRLIATQFPQWADLPVRPVELNGWDNITFRLGDNMSVPLPSPEPLAQGAPGCGYPWPWSVYRWLDGKPAVAANVTDLGQYAADLADFLTALYQIDTSDGPAAGYETCFFGVPLAHWDSQTRESLAALGGQIDTRLAVNVWEAALAAAWRGPAVWFHGDISPGNLLVSQGRLSA